MARVTESEVRDLVPNISDISMTPFITAANNLTTRVSSQDSDSVLSAADLKEIERWLAAHFYAHRDQQYTEKKTGDATAVFQGQTGLALSSTFWGQQAMVLDFTGYLAKLNTQIKTGQRHVASATWLGKPPSSQTDYKDRD